MNANYAVVEILEAHLRATQHRNEHQKIRPVDLVTMLETAQQIDHRVNTLDTMMMGILIDARSERTASSIELRVGTGYPFSCKATSPGCEKCSRRRN